LASRLRIAIVASVLLAVCATPADAQYFGRNKVQYRTFDFQVLKTAHFDFYYYPEEREAAGIASRMAERWYGRLSRFFSHELRGRQPVILYAVSAHFRQTNAIEGLIGEGTGGVTEALKRRIVLPVSGSLADTDHVLGHELVHAFQFDMTGADPRDLSAGAPGILEFPLWFAEGMAEYLSLGPIDAQTAMWLRDAALREKLPAIKDLDNPKYFPYRWGHAFWAYVGGRYGDRTVASLVRSAANPRYDLAGLARQLGTDPETLTRDWHQAILKDARAIAATQPLLSSEPRLLVNQESGGGRFNIGPRVSPDGRQIAFFSSRDEFSIDMYLADAASGRVERRLVRSATDPHFDSLEFLNSAGSWSPDGRHLALTAVRGGKPVIALIDTRSGRIDREIDLPGLDDALNPSFSPDGASIVLSGNQGGLIDLYVLRIEAAQLVRLTHDPFADLEPTFTPDGASVVFVTERYTTDLATLRPGALRLARVDVTTHEVRPIAGFLRGKHISPQVSADGRQVTFIADPDGISNVYRMPIDGGPIVQLSSFPTGVAGITSSSPALSTSAATGRSAFSVFQNDGHAIYVLDEAKVVAQVAPAPTPAGAVLPGRIGGTGAAIGDVERFLGDALRDLPPATTPAVPGPADATPLGLSLDAVGQPTLTAGVSQFGSHVSGSVWAVFTDMLGDRQLAVAGEVGGTLADLGGQLLYVNRRHRWNYALSVAQVPYRIGYFTRTDLPDGTVAVREVVERQVSSGASVAALYPLSTATRLEFGAGARRLSFSRDVTTGTFDSTFTVLFNRDREHTTSAPTMYLAESTTALVHDTSFFGATSPIYGGRYRFEISQSAGTLSYTGVLLDWRRYYMPKRPITIAVRGVHYARYGTDAEHPQLLSVFSGDPELVHGYGYGSIGPSECRFLPGGKTCAAFDSLLGSRLLVANIEVRAPLVGLFRGDIDYGRVPIELAGFFDAGVSWTRDSLPTFAGGPRAPLRSYGTAVRVNAFGLLVVEVSASRPLTRAGAGWQWQVGLRQGF
jgi:Tol biopolymer transport system component